MANPQQEMQKSFARVLGYDGPMQGFGNYIQSDPAISEKYRGMLAIAEKQRDMAKQNMMRMSQSPKPQMAQGGVVRKFQQGGFNPFQAGTQAVVYGPDGTQYGNGMIAERAGVTDYSYTQPPNQRNQPNPNDIAKATLGGNMIPAGERDQTSALQNSLGGLPTVPAGFKAPRQDEGMPSGQKGFAGLPPSGIAKAELGGNMTPERERKLTALLGSIPNPEGYRHTYVAPNDKAYTYELAVARQGQRDIKTPEEARLIQEALARGPGNDLSVLPPTVQGGVKTLDTAQSPQQAFQDVQRPVYDTNQFLDDGTTPNPNYGQPIMDAEGNPLTTTEAPNIGEMGAQMITQPGLPTGAAVEAVGVDPGTGQFLQTSVGGVTPSGVAVPTTLADTATVQQQQATAATQLDPSLTQGKVEGVLAQGGPAQGGVSTQAQVQAQQQIASSVSQLNAAQGTASTMQNPVQREIQDGELISGVANAEKASKYAEQIEAATATPSEKATVQGQLASLTADFDANNPPAWAAGALRGIQGQLAARGLGASSIAGQALIQGALESALPIAQADAQTQAQFETQNLSNRQQRAMLAAQQRAQFIGQEFDQAFQARVQNSARIGDIANMNFTAEQNIALENSRAVNTMNLNNLSNRQAMVIAEASALANLDMSNLNNRQQSAVQNAQSFLQMDMANLSNSQQSQMFKAQQRVQSMFTDQAAQNAAKQFNATSQNQVDQFFAQLGQQANQFNATQYNAQEQFNAGQTNTVERFNAELNNARDIFNAQNQQVIAQSNAAWRRQIASADTAAINRANELNAQSILGISNQAYNNLWQYYGDTMEWAWTSAENERSRVIDLAKAQLMADSNADVAKMKNDYNSSAAFGGLMTKFIGGALGF